MNNTRDLNTQLRGINNTHQEAIPVFLRAESVPEGVKVVRAGGTGNVTTELIGFEDAVRRLDTGEYDDKPDEGYAIHFAIADGGNRGWFNFTALHNLTMWRWLIAAVFIDEIKKKNGPAILTESNGTTSLVAIYISNGKRVAVYPASERLAMINFIEGAMIERFGIVEGIENATGLYRAMLDRESGKLTPFGRITQAKFYDRFFAVMGENVIHELPVMH